MVNMQPFGDEDEDGDEETAPEQHTGAAASSRESPPDSNAAEEATDKYEKDKQKFAELLNRLNLHNQPERTRCREPKMAENKPRVVRRTGTNTTKDLPGGALKTPSKQYQKKPRELAWDQPSQVENQRNAHKPKVQGGGL